MPKKAAKESQEAQSERFRADVRRMIDAGELNLTEADELFGRLFEVMSSRKLSNQ